MKLSNNFWLIEFTRSDLAKRLGISNQPSKEHLENIKLLCAEVLEPIREHFDTPIFISSGYRSIELNKKTPGASKTSQHSTGEAVDIDMDGSIISNADVFNFIKDNLIFDQLIWEFGTDSNPAWVHVSYESKGLPRKQILKAVKSGGKKFYRKFK
jgi:hypothetical protein